MKQSKTTKRALLFSVISMLLCLTMLIGSTFAWFTDSVTSGKNKIVAGNLDVELEYTTTPDVEDSWQQVNENTNIFKEGTKWEPGYTEVVYLRVKNVGSLALKYKLGINVAGKVIGKTADGANIDLSNFIEFGVVETDKVYADRAEAMAAVNGKTQLISDGYSSEQGKLEKEQISKLLALVVFMPEDVGNEANHGTGKTAPSIDLGISLVATQDTVEEDSFGTDYDAAALYPITVLPAVESNMTPATPNADSKIESFSYTDSGVQATFTPTTPYEETAEAPKLVIEPTEVKEASAAITAAGLDAVAYDIKLQDSTGNVLSGTGKTVFTLNVGKNLWGLKMYHNDTEMTKATSAADVNAANKYYYDKVNGTVTFMVDSFSEFTIAYEPPMAVINGVGYNTLTAALKAVPADSTEPTLITLLKDEELSIKPLTLTQNVTIDLNGHTLTGASYKSALDVKDATVIIKNGTIEATPAAAGSALYAEGSSNVLVENCTIKSNGNKTYVVCTNGAKSLDSTIVIKNSTISAPTAAGKKGYALYAPAGNVTFENCDVTGHIFISGGNVTLDGGTYTATGFNGQAKIWNKADTASYVVSQEGGTAYNMGDSILIVDRRDGYTLSSLTIRNITFNTEITLKDGTQAIAYAIKYVDMNANGAANPVNYVIEHNTFNNQIEGGDPVMYINTEGNDIT